MRVNSLMLFVVTSTLFGSASADETAWLSGLSDRELAIQRWFSSLTYMQGHEAKPWTEWFDDGDQFGVTALRYQFAFCGYGCAAMAAKTPAYRELIQQQLLDLCLRMIDRRTWPYVTAYWKYGENPPDPCKYENVMYTGHLTQLMSLYELMTGDMRFSDAGWDFTWEDGRSIHYRLEDAIRGLHDQSMASASGGICCEPGLIFADCNSHSASSFVVFDVVHGASYSGCNQRWFDWMNVHFRNKVPFTPDFLYVIYDTKKDFFYPAGDIGADCWALGFGYPWFPDKKLLEEGWKTLLKRSKWIESAENQCYAKNNTVVGCCGGSTLGMANSFVPLVGVQAEGKDCKKAQQVLNWLETTYGRELDTDGDGFTESYAYVVCPKHRIPATGVIATALATDGDSMRQLYRTSRKPILSEPALAHVDYPNVMVRAAEYHAPVLRFVIRKENPVFSGTTEFRCTQIPGTASVSRDGAPWSSFSQTGPELTITSDVDVEHIFEIRIDPPSAG
ncbi:MAG TPA: hypothetical protein PLI09_24965 [Candidatus Hydrogenedentes bacterium]|nr:hypothetical protein [Candidatus Hydrogenedentota bacterium]